jgi:uncharacterized membrane protein
MLRKLPEFILLAQSPLPGTQPGRPASPWEVWPFSSGGEEPILFVLTKGLFIIAIFAVVILFVRWAFGPGGALAEPWMREEWAQRRQRQLDQLEQDLAEGKITRQRYERKKRKLEKPV